MKKILFLMACAAGLTVSITSCGGGAAKLTEEELNQKVEEMYSAKSDSIVKIAQKECDEKYDGLVKSKYDELLKSAEEAAKEAAKPAGK